MNILKKILSLASKENPVPRRYITPMRQAGVQVTHDSAMTLPAVFACVRLISEDIAKLPWQAYRKNGEMRERADNSRVEYLLNSRPNPEMTAFSFRELLVSWALTWGNGYAEIERDSGMRPIALWPLAPDRVEAKRDDQGIYYEVTNDRGQKSLVNQSNMFHLHGLGYDGITGYSVIGYAARTVGLGIATDEFGASFFGNNTILGGYIKHPGALSDTAYGRLKEGIGQRKGVKNAFGAEVLEEGMDWVQSGIPPEDAQFIETRKFTVNEIARWFRVPPHKISDLERATFSNIEEQEISYVNDTLMSWIVRLEQEAQSKLIGSRSIADYTKINIKGLLRGNAESRANYYREMRNMGVYSVNDIRALEDENPIGPEGDKRVVQMNMTTLERIGEEPVKQEPVRQLDNPDQQGDQQAKGIYFKLIEKELVGIYAKEDRRLRSVTDLDESGFVDFVTDYYVSSHIDWVQDVLSECINSICNDMQISDTGAIISYINRHVSNGRKRAFQYYRKEKVDINEMAKAEAKHIITEVIDDHQIKRIKNAV